ncbi:sodium:solute symporter [Adhaeribacter aerolatus]|uniref:Sodium:solute symporter n=1 Tax=Adhaeribacter aerolatus TaxID=670289 RepID=A0A512AX36_9BACT|nr:sodium:solute symporter family protein [Adhaeribacter aerolatus]GEO04292.1 sodium:solute symporter [Adhaeribacter aerolatus]
MIFLTAGKVINASGRFILFKMLLFFILLYLTFNVLLGFWASRRVNNTQDFLLAGRKLTLPMATAVVFATWFGSETLLGASSEFAEKGLIGVIEDPFGAALCLFLVGLFFARKLYRMNLLTFGDFYRVRYNRQTELIASIFLVVSYFGWIAAQLVALGIILNLVVNIPLIVGILLGFIVVVGYTYLGGMWSVSVTDFLQTIMIILGLLFVVGSLLIQFPFSEVMHQPPADFFRFTPVAKAYSTEWINYFAMWITIGLGSIPQQDVFQRVMSSKSEKVAVYASFMAGILYLTVAFMPLLISLYAKVLHPELMQQDTQLLLPVLILQQSSMWMKVLFFGALLSAIMSTASGAMLAPAAILSENILKPVYRNITDKQLLHLSRVSVLLVAVVSLGFALLRSNIYELVSESSALSLVSLFVPMVAGIYIPRTSSRAAFISMLAGMGVWLMALAVGTAINPLIYGLGASFLGLGLGLFWWPKLSGPIIKAEAFK